MQTRAFLLLATFAGAGAIAAEPESRDANPAPADAAVTRPALDLDRSETISPVQKKPKRVRYTIPPPKRM